jgi:hypothetical protein
MAEGRGAAVPPPCRLGGAAGDAAPAPGRECCGGCGLGLARLVRRLRRRGRRALRASASQPRRRACQYDPLSYARNFDLGGCDDDNADDAARVRYSCSFSSRFVLVPTASQSAGAVSAGAAPAAVSTAS